MAEVSAQTKKAVFKQNQHLFSGYKIVATLDARTTPQCRARDGKLYDINYQPVGHTMLYGRGEPWHWGCRSVTIPIVKPYDKLVKDMPPKQAKKLRRIPPAQRAAMNGVVPGDTTFDGWLGSLPPRRQKQILGPKRWDFWKRKKLSMADMIDPTGRPLRLDELGLIKQPTPVTPPDKAAALLDAKAKAVPKAPEVPKKAKADGRARLYRHG